MSIHNNSAQVLSIIFFVSLTVNQSDSMETNIQGHLQLDLEISHKDAILTSNSKPPSGKASRTASPVDAFVAEVANSP